MLGSRGSIDQCSIPVSSNNAIIVYIRWFKIVRILLGSILAHTPQTFTKCCVLYSVRIQIFMNK